VLIFIQKYHLKVLFKNHFVIIFAVPEKAEAGSAGEQPARNTLVHENEPAYCRFFCYILLLYAF